ncbi:MAG: transcription/translation regulatory transformer protein RfaH [Candidatus Thioglobus sp.]|nr:transcription/translation regulatory transformer protein RfaH [Candidatus Thioglobus sp.]MBT4421836.1 transcription/translation regulatory transformer protein RfaH [Candidatus Thioglobus sp.]
MKNWYLIQTKPKQEAVAQQNLSDQNFTVFCPKAVIKGKTVSLFPRYLFIELDDKNQNWTPIRSTRGVANFVRFGLTFAKVPSQIINMIKIQQQQTIEKMINICSHQQGDTVEIQTGAFKGQKAIFQNYNSSDRITILLKIIGQQQEVLLSENEVVAI